MKYIKFEWDEAKNLSNQQKHRISFDEAKTVFYDQHARLIHEPDHSDTESRFILSGLTSSLKLLLVVHTYRKNDQIIQIISTRKATKNEARFYHRRK